MSLICDNFYDNSLIGILTSSGRTYYKIIKMMKEIEFKFESLEPSSIISSNVTILLTSRNDKFKYTHTKIIFIEDVKDSIDLKHKIFNLMDFDNHKLLIGIDPGLRIGFAVYNGNYKIHSSVFFNIIQLEINLKYLIQNYSNQKKIIRIGNGDQPISNKIISIINKLPKSNIVVEIVDEWGTSFPHFKPNTRGSRDKRSAEIIAFRSGYKL